MLDVVVPDAISEGLRALTEYKDFHVRRESRMNEGCTRNRAARIHRFPNVFSGLRRELENGELIARKNSIVERRIKLNFAPRYQFVYLSQSKFQSWSLCSVDARPPRLHTCSSLYEEGV